MSKFVPRFYATFEEGKLKIHNPSGFREYLGTLNGKLELLVYEWKSKRTGSQNNYFHAFIRLIADEIGDANVEDLKEWFKDEAGEKVEVEKFGKKKMVNKSTALYSRSEMVSFIQRIEIISGIPAPDPNKFKVID